MAVLVDFNQILFSSFFAAVGKHTNVVIEESMIRHMTLNTIRTLRHKFKYEDADFVICSDSTVGNWRREYFPNYKCRRRKSRDKSDVDWPAIYSAMDNIRDEIRDNFPYTYVQVDGCEADDIIGVLANYVGRHMPVTIISGDKDFRQLLTRPDIKIYDPGKKLIHRYGDFDAKEYLEEHIIGGDKDDDVPNILSDSDTFAEGRRQVVMTKKRKEMLQGIRNRENDKYYDNYLRNKTLIDLSCTPAHLCEEVIEQHKRGPITNNSSKLSGYMMEHRLGNLLEHMDEF